MNTAQPIAPEPERASPMRLLAELLFRNWGLKAIALVLAAFMFVFTRDEVTRVFTVPLRAVADPERVLMTDLPETVQVQARGPWVRINRLQDYDFGVATIDIKAARPGPLEVERGAIVMPEGVVLAGITYDTVDLRFDPIIERKIDVDAKVEGQPAPDYELLRVEVQPTRWMVRGGETSVQRIKRLSTEVVELRGADQDMEVEVALLPLSTGVALVGAGSGGASVTVRAIIAARAESRSYTVPVVVPDGLDPTGVVPRTYEVKVAGPMPDFRVLDGMEVTFPVAAQATRVQGDGDGGGVAEVSFSWAPGVPADLRERLDFDHGVERIRLPAPMPPPPTLDQPEAPG